MAGPSTTQSASESLTWHDAPFRTPSDRYPPPKRDPRLVRFVIISDTHNTEPDVPDGDVLLHSGDLTIMGSAEDVERAFAWLGSLPHKHKYVIAGNHDFGLCTRDDWYEKRGRELHRRYRQPTTDPERARQAARKWEEDGTQNDMTHRYLEDERAEFDVGGRRWSVYGSPWTPDFESWAWNHHRGEEAKKLYSSLPQTDILLTHGPPHRMGNLDHLTDNVTHVGCEELTAKLERGDIRPLIHCCGHIHEARGIHHQEWDKSNGSNGRVSSAASDAGSVLHTETLIVNSAMVEFSKGFKYGVVNSAIVVDVDPSKLPRAHETSAL